MKNSNNTSLAGLLTITAALAMASPARAQGFGVIDEPLEPDKGVGWSLTTDEAFPDFPPEQTDWCVWFSSANAKAQSNGYAASGSGKAYDATLGCDVRVQNAATGVRLLAWTYCGNECFPKGWGKVKASAKANGVVNLHTSNSAAVAVGYAVVASNLCGPVNAVIEKSAAETTSGTLGDIEFKIEDVGVTIPVKVSTGTGVYPDSDKDADVGEECTNFVKVKYKSKAYVEFYADEFVFDGSCDGNMSASGSASVTLGICEEEACEDPDPPKTFNPGVIIPEEVPIS